MSWPGHIRLPSTFLSILLVATAATAAGPDRRMAVTLDDLPAQRAQSRTLAELRNTNEAIVETLLRQRVPAIGFVNEGKLEVDGTVLRERVRLLEGWLDAGLELGNHTYSHPDLHRTVLAEFMRDVLDGERITRPLAEKRGLPWRFFRHPFLHSGNDLETKTALETFLTDHGYRVAPVTVDNSEWIYSVAYDEARKRTDESLAVRVAVSYLDYMEAVVAFYEDQSRALFGREIQQILLIHANPLNADHLSDLLERLRGRGYRFVSLDEALTDPAYESADNYTGAGGITWIHRWALTRKVDPEMFRGEPEAPPWIVQLAGLDD